MPVVREWRGEVPFAVGGSDPPTGHVADFAAWAKLWRALRGDEPVPPIDFGQELVRVVVGNDPNHVSVRAEVDDRGDARLCFQKTLVAYTDPQTCKYQLAVIPRAGLRRIKGQPVR